MPRKDPARTSTQIRSTSNDRAKPAPPSSAAASHPITLESLPAELRHKILALVLDMEDLKALVLASPVFHQQYLLNRKAFLRRTLKAALGNVFVDAYAVHTSALLREQ